MAEEVNSHFSEKQRQGDKSDKSKNVDNSHANYAVRIYLVYLPLKKKIQRAFAECFYTALCKVSSDVLHVPQSLCLTQGR